MISAIELRKHTELKTRMTENVFEIIERHSKFAPVDIYSIIDDLGIEFRCPHLDDEISGMLERTPTGVYRISVNASHPEVRRRFTAAHELGHYVYHRDLIGDGVDDDRLYRSTSVGQYFNQNIKAAEETQANRFAANVLMPTKLIEELQRRGTKGIEALADSLLVSKAAIRIRLGLD